MNRFFTFTVALFVVFSATAQENPAIHAHDVMNNWGKWGKSDQKGALNYITPEHIVKAASLIKSGKTFSLAIPINSNGPRIITRQPPHHFMTGTGTDAQASGNAKSNNVGFTDDYIYMPLQGSTQWDALSHAFYGGAFYNGYPLDSVSASGASKLGLEQVRDGFVGRAVLIDVVRYKGGSIESGYGITRDDLEGALKAQGTKVQEGDIVVIRTGEVPRYYTMPRSEQHLWWTTQTGITKSVVPWIKEKKIAAIAADNLAMEQTPNADGRNYNLHGNILRDLGVFIGEIWSLDELAADCAQDGRYDFFIAAQPLHIPGAVGSPINPIAIK